MDIRYSSLEISGVLNIFGDIFFVFTCDMGIEGAGLATMLGQLAALVILRWHVQRGVCVFLKSTNKAHIEENIDIFDANKSVYFSQNDLEMVG
jgi:Na+-driven multidrug efflux pump